MTIEERVPVCQTCAGRPGFWDNDPDPGPGKYSPRVIAWHLMTEEGVPHEQTGYTPPKHRKVRARQFERIAGEHPGLVNVAFEALTHNDVWAVRFVRRMNKEDGVALFDPLGMARGPAVESIQRAVERRRNGA